jgi:hypothetical protein
MEGTIRIELRTEHTPDSGSGLPDLGHDARRERLMVCSSASRRSSSAACSSHVDALASASPSRSSRPSSIHS